MRKSIWGVPLGIGLFIASFFIPKVAGAVPNSNVAPKQQTSQTAQKDSLEQKKLDDVILHRNKSETYKPIIKSYFDPSEITKVGVIWAPDNKGGFNAYHTRDFQAGKKLVITPTVEIGYYGEGKDFAKYYFDAATGFFFKRQGLLLVPVSSWDKEERNTRTNTTNNSSYYNPRSNGATGGTIGETMRDKEEDRENKSRQALGLEHRGAAGFDLKLQGAIEKEGTENIDNQTVRHYETISDTSIERQGNFLVEVYSRHDLEAITNALVNAQTKKKYNAFMFEVDKRVSNTKPIDFGLLALINRQTLETRVKTDVETNLKDDWLTDIFVTGNNGRYVTHLKGTNYEENKDSSLLVNNTRQDENVIGFNLAYNRNGRKDIDFQYKQWLTTNKISVNALSNFTLGKRDNWCGWVDLGAEFGMGEIGIGLINSDNQFTREAMSEYSRDYYRDSQNQVILNERQLEQARRNKLSKLANNTNGCGAYANIIYGEGHYPETRLGCVFGGTVSGAIETYLKHGRIALMTEVGTEKIKGYFKTDGSGKAEVGASLAFQ